LVEPLFQFGAKRGAGRRVLQNVSRARNPQRAVGFSQPPINGLGGAVNPVCFLEPGRHLATAVQLVRYEYGIETTGEDAGRAGPLGELLSRRNARFAFFGLRLILCICDWPHYRSCSQTDAERREHEMTAPVPNQAVERTVSQPTGRVAGGGVRGGWLAFAHFYR